MATLKHSRWVPTFTSFAAIYNPTSQMTQPSRLKFIRDTLNFRIFEHRGFRIYLPLSRIRDAAFPESRADMDVYMGHVRTDDDSLPSNFDPDRTEPEVRYVRIACADMNCGCKKPAPRRKPPTDKRKRTPTRRKRSRSK